MNVPSIAIIVIRTLKPIAYSPIGQCMLTVVSIRVIYFPFWILNFICLNRLIHRDRIFNDYLSLCSWICGMISLRWKNRDISDIWGTNCSQMSLSNIWWIRSIMYWHILLLNKGKVVCSFILDFFINKILMIEPLIQ